MGIILFIILSVVYAVILHNQGAGSPLLTVLVWVKVATVVFIFITLGWIAGVLAWPIGMVTIYVTARILNKK
jgi:hypothetical protein